MAAYWEHVLAINDYQKSRFAQNLVSSMFNTISGKRIALWGFAFKKDTNDTRESAAIHIAHDLLDEQAHLAIYDPQVSAEQILSDIESTFHDRSGDLAERERSAIRDGVEICDSPAEAAENAHAIAVLTEWDEFRTLDYEAIYKSMHKPAFLFDGRNLLDARLLASLGFEVHSIGKDHSPGA